MLEKVTCPHCECMTYRFLKCQKCGMRLETDENMENGSAEPSADHQQDASESEVAPKLMPMDALGAPSRPNDAAETDDAVAPAADKVEVKITLTPIEDLASLGSPPEGALDVEQDSGSTPNKKITADKLEKQASGQAEDKTVVLEAGCIEAESDEGEDEPAEVVLQILPEQVELSENSESEPLAFPGEDVEVLNESEPSVTAKQGVTQPESEPTLADLIKEARGEKLGKIYQADIKVLVDDVEQGIAGVLEQLQAESDSAKAVEKTDDNPGEVKKAQESSGGVDSMRDMLKELDTLVDLSQMPVLGGLELEAVEEDLAESGENQEIETPETKPSEPVPVVEIESPESSSDPDESGERESLKASLVNGQLVKMNSNAKEGQEPRDEKKKAMAELESNEFSDLRANKDHTEVTARMKDTSWFARENKESQGDDGASESGPPSHLAQACGKTVAERIKNVAQVFREKADFPHLSDRKEGQETETASSSAGDERLESEIIRKVAFSEVGAESKLRSAAKNTRGGTESEGTVSSSVGRVSATSEQAPVIHKRPVLAIKKPNLEDQVKLIVSITKAGVDPESALAACLIEHTDLAGEYAEFVRKKPMSDRTRINNTLNEQIEGLSDIADAGTLVRDYIHAEAVQ